MAKRIKYSEEQINTLLENIWDDKVNPYFLPHDLYEAIAENLKAGLYEGFGATMETVEGLYGKASAELLNELRTNIYQFSAAKTFNMVEEMRGVLVEGDKVLTLNEFKAKANVIFEKYNNTWLETEYNTAIGQAETGRKWKEIEKQRAIFPYLKYNAVNDSHTSDICRPLDDVIRPVGDPFWKEFTPLNHFNCRCVIEQLETPKG
jgi:SPP1 gp7 family putative phage head morphogenesis protein